jgi:gluconokinase
VIILLMGVQGSGKTTVGQALAERLGWRFADADSFHPPENIAKMAAGVPLDDADRAPWLAALRTEIDRTLRSHTNLVLTCSALKDRYRRVLLTDGVALVYLRGTQALIASRLASRAGHFAKLDLLKSQFVDLEEPTDAFNVDVSSSVPEIVQAVADHFGLS